MNVRRRALPRSGLMLSEIGFGGAPLGNLYRAIGDEEGRSTLEAALDAGVTYVDTAPRYGHGLSERRVGDVLRTRSNVVLSTKVGRLFRADRRYEHSEAERRGFLSPMPFEQIYDYTYDGIRRSFEDSLHRLGLARIDILYVHDIGEQTHGKDHDRTFTQLTTGGGLKALEELRCSGDIAAFGIGVNECAICHLVMDFADLDIVLIAGRYSLLDQSSLTDLFPRCEAAGTAVVVGGAYNSGILATGTRSGFQPFFEYAPAPPAIIERVRLLEAACDEFSVPLASAALKFSLSHPVIASVVLGLDSRDRVAETVQLYNTDIPMEFWNHLIDHGLIDPASPIPGASL